MNTIDQSQLLGFVGKATVGGVSAGGGSGGGSSSGWMRALAESAKSTLDAQATKITNLSDALSGGADKPSDVINVTTAAMEMQFKSTSVNTQLTSASEAMKKIAESR